MQECIQEAIKCSFIWLGKKILEGTLLISDLVFPVIAIVCIGLSIGGYSKAKKAIPCSIILYIFLQIFRLFIWHTNGYKVRNFRRIKKDLHMCTS